MQLLVLAQISDMSSVHLCSVKALILGIINSCVVVQLTCETETYYLQHVLMLITPYYLLRKRGANHRMLAVFSKFIFLYIYYKLVQKV